jgi:hypothetical protein
MSTNDASNTYHADHELAALLKAAARSGERVRVQTDDTTYEIKVTPAPERDAMWAGHDAQAARVAWRAMAGVLSDQDVNAQIEEMKRNREQRAPESKHG